MTNIIKKELIIYTALLTLLIVLMHPDLLSHPTARLGLMQEKGNYIHPLLYTFFVYLVLYFFRFIFSFIMKLFRKK
jgi:ABC-type multidrug transport system fused ATPase/permease subunit